MAEPRVPQNLLPTTGGLSENMAMDAGPMEAVGTPASALLLMPSWTRIQSNSNLSQRSLIPHLQSLGDSVAPGPQGPQLLPAHSSAFPRVWPLPSLWFSQQHPKKQAGRSGGRERQHCKSLLRRWPGCQVPYQLTPYWPESRGHA